MHDANVLYPQWLRHVMLTLTVMGCYDPRWSTQIWGNVRFLVTRDVRRPGLVKVVCSASS